MPAIRKSETPQAKVFPGLKKGEIVTIPSNAIHCIQNISRFVRLIDSFSPVREDFLKNI